MSTLPNKELLRPDEVAEYFSVSVKTIYRWIDEGKVPAVKVAQSVIRIERKAALNLKKPA